MTASATYLVKIERSMRETLPIKTFTYHRIGTRRVIRYHA